jgi:hypothetical protein
LGDAVKASRTGSTQDDGFQGGQAEIRERGGAFGRLSNTKEYPSSDDYDQVMEGFSIKRIGGESKRKRAGNNRGDLVYERIRIESL